MNIIIADKHPIMIEGIKCALESIPGYKVVAVTHNGIQLLNILKRTQPDMIISDISLKEMSGIQVCKLLKHQGATLKFVFVTSYIDEEILNLCKNSGAEALLSNTMPKENFIEAICSISSHGNTIFSNIISNNSCHYIKPFKCFIF